MRRILKKLQQWIKQRLSSLPALAGLTLALILFQPISPVLAYNFDDFLDSWVGKNDSLQTKANFEVAKQFTILKGKAIWEVGLAYEGNVTRLTDNNSLIYKNKIIF